MDLHVRERNLHQGFVGSPVLAEVRSLQLPIGPYRVGETYYCRELFALSKQGKVVYKVGYKGNIKYRWGWEYGAMGADKARIFLKVKEVRLRRLHDMTVEDSLKDGVKPNPKAKNPLSTYMRIWDEEQKIKWKENPWVWVLTVERVENEG